jgi:hypothetical protein
MGYVYPMGYTPRPYLPPVIPRKPISVADDSTFEAWIALPDGDDRTIEEFAANPVRHTSPGPYPSRPPRTVASLILDTGFMKSSLAPPPQNTSIKM